VFSEIAAIIFKHSRSLTDTERRAMRLYCKKKYKKLSISKNLIKNREELKKSSLVTPSGGELLWKETGRSDVE
jgi:hypothetical protein